MKVKQIIGKWTVKGTDSASGKATALPTAAAVRATFDGPWDAHLRP